MMKIEYEDAKKPILYHDSEFDIGDVYVGLGKDLETRNIFIKISDDKAFQITGEIIVPIMKYNKMVLIYTKVNAKLVIKEK